MDKTYQPKQLEAHWYKQWEKHGYFKPDTHPDGQPYCIMMPPPNVTGYLHMGHAFQHTLMDVLIRNHRMQGNCTLWQTGTDHAGIATQMVVERQWLKRGISRQSMGRDKFVQHVWDWKKTSGNAISEQMRKMGISVDWSRECFTMDDNLSKAVQEVFIQLYDEKLIYRGHRLVNWDPTLLTAVSDLEVVSEEEDGYLWHIAYPLIDGDGHLVVATTRPETLLGDTAVAVHPDDERYKSLIGKQIKLPLAGRAIPIIADTYVDPEFGSGCVKITPAHDFNDYEVGQRHQLPMINIFTEDAKLNTEVPEDYQGLDRFEARKVVIEDLEELGLLVKTEAHRLKVPRGDRSGSVIEPYLTPQWFVKAETLAQPAIDAVKTGKIQFVPKQWENTYFAWLENIQDWCISRQLWWGHRIPAWYDAVGRVYVGPDENSVRQKYNLDPNVPLSQDEDVLDTWFSSALWTFSTLGWPEETEELQRFHPTSTLVTGFDIIFFWVARMIMMTLKFRGEVPFKTVYVHGLVRDSEGQKMSKSKGNVLDPLDLIDGIELDALVQKRTRDMMQPQMAEKIAAATRKAFPDGIPAFGTDALRFTFCTLASTGRDIQFDLSRIEGNRNFCNKLWNASRFVLMNVEQHGTAYEGYFSDREPSHADLWIQSRLHMCIARVQQAIDTYRFDLASQNLYEFVWNEYCDWYVELAKPVLYSETASVKAKATTIITLLEVLENILRLLHPFMPFITEEIWQKISPLVNLAGDTIMLEPYPKPDESRIDHDSVKGIEWLQAVVTQVRNIRGEMNISPSKKLTVVLDKGTDADRNNQKAYDFYLKTLAKLEKVAWKENLSEDEVPLMSASGLVGQLEIHIPLSGVIDVEDETQRLSKEISKLQDELQRVSQKLNNPQFMEKAPAELIQRDKTRQQELQEALKQRISQRDKLVALV